MSQLGQYRANSLTPSIKEFIPDSGTSPVTPGSSGEVTVTGGTTGFTFVGTSHTLTLTGAPNLISITFLDDTDSPYTVLSTDLYLSCDVSSGALTIEFPDAPSTGRIYYIKDSGGNAATHNITLTTVSGVVTIDGSTSFVMNTDYEASSIIFNGSSYEIY